MGKLLRPRDRILLGLAILGDLYDEMRNPGGLVGASYKQMYGFTPKRYRKRNFTSLVSRSLKTGNIEKIIKGEEIFFRLTPSGKDKIKKDFPLIDFRNRRWDGIWRLVVFDIPENQAGARNRLREKLKELGFGMLQKSIWISPHNIVDDFREFLLANGLSETVFVLEARNIAGFSDQEMAEKVFKLKDLNRKYEEIIDDYSRMGEREEKKRFQFKRKYLEIAIKDPILPKELLPREWAGEKARKIVLGKIISANN